MEQGYPIIHIYPTIQGQGPRSGEPMTLIRTSTPPEFTEFCYFKPLRKVEMKMMTIQEIVQRCIELGPKWVFFGGDDPCIGEFDELVKNLRREGFRIWLDTNGAFYFNMANVDYISVGPKPGITFNPEVVQNASDVRLYWRDTDEGIWLDLFRKVEPFVPENCPIMIAPRVLTQSCVDSVIKFVLNQSETKKMVRADIPLFRTLPNFDKNFNQGIDCPLCHLMDKFQGVEVKSCLEEEEKKNLDIPEPYPKRRRRRSR